MATGYSQINALEEITFIGGTEYTIEFIVREESGAYANLSGSTCSWKMCPYGEPDNVILSYNGNITGSYTFEVTIPSADTLTLSGKFLHQPIIDDGLAEYRSQQGIINISPAIQ